MRPVIVPHNTNDPPPPRPRRWLMLLVGIVLGVVLVMLFKAAGGQPLPSYTRTPTPLPPTAPKLSETRVIDGDTIVQGGVHVRLWGIDAPELGQICKDGWPAGEKSRGFLRVLVEGGLVVCDNRGLDKYGRTLAVCTARGADINQAMVRTGNAWAYTTYSRAYVLDEITARQAKAGVWAHNCIPAWEWRHRK